MKFIDYAIINIKSGDGGAGHISFRREKFVPKGGPDGGRGGKGGDVIIKAEKHMSTLLDFKFHRNFNAQDGKEGGNANKSGKSGKNMIIKVPKGTLIKNKETGAIICDITAEDQSEIIAKGGIGGRGNVEFATPTHQAPRKADLGRPGTEMQIQLELKLLADVGLVGFPNAGKSTLISVISSAKPKIADYPFTTLVPNLGIVKIGDYQNYTVADIPGLIEGASEGKGLGATFLRHVDRTSTLVFLIDAFSSAPKEDYETLMNELVKYNPEMQYKKKIICISKMDSVDGERRKELMKVDFSLPDTPVMFISSVTYHNIENLKWKMWELVKNKDD